MIERIDANTEDIVDNVSGAQYVLRPRTEPGPGLGSRWTGAGADAQIFEALSLVGRRAMLTPTSQQTRVAKVLGKMVLLTVRVHSIADTPF